MTSCWTGCFAHWFALLHVLSANPDGDGDGRELVTELVVVEGGCEGSAGGGAGDGMVLIA